MTNDIDIKLKNLKVIYLDIVSQHKCWDRDGTRPELGSVCVSAFIGIKYEELAAASQPQGRRSMLEGKHYFKMFYDSYILLLLGVFVKSFTIISVVWFLPNDTYSEFLIHTKRKFVFHWICNKMLMETIL